MFSFICSHEGQKLFSCLGLCVDHFRQLGHPGAPSHSRGPCDNETGAPGTAIDRPAHPGEALQREVVAFHRPRCPRRSVCMGLMFMEYRVVTEMGQRTWGDGHGVTDMG